jgi:hypothetical protein
LKDLQKSSNRTKFSQTSLTNRFKNKVEKLGKHGIFALNSSHPIDKSDIPESKIHHPLIKVYPSTKKLMIAKNAPNLENSSQNLNFFSNRS